MVFSLALAGSLNFSKDLVAVAVRPDAKVFATGGWDDKVTVRSWPGKQVLRVHKGHKEHVTGLSYSADGSLLASSGADGTIRIWSGTGSKLLRTIRGRTSFLSSVALSPDGRAVYASGYDNLVKRWDTNTGRMTASYKGLPSDAYSMALSPDGKTVAGVGPEASAAWWSTETGKVRELTGTDDENFVGVAFSPDSKLLALGSLQGHLVVVRAADGRVLLDRRAKIGSVSTIAWSDGATLLCAGYDEGIEKVTLSEGEAPDPLQAVGDHVFFFGLAVVPGTTSALAVGGGGDSDGLTCHFDFESWKIIGFSPL